MRILNEIIAMNYKLKFLPSLPPPPNPSQLGGNGGEVEQRSEIEKYIILPQGPDVKEDEISRWLPEVKVQTSGIDFSCSDMMVVFRWPDLVQSHMLSLFYADGSSNATIQTLLKAFKLQTKLGDYLNFETKSNQ